MLLVGLTGGIGAGKSSVARLLRDRGAVVIDADAIVHELYEPGTPVYRRVVQRFGEDIVRPDGTLDRAAIGEIVFHDEDSRAALNAIVHPEVMRVIAERTEELGKGDDIVVLDVPLLVEAGGGGGMDLIVVVSASEDVRVERLVRDRGMSPAEVRARIAVQASTEQREALADVIIRNDGDLASLRDQVGELWQQLERMRTEAR